VTDVVLASLPACSHLQRVAASSDGSASQKKQVKPARPAPAQPIGLIDPSRCPASVAKGRGLHVALVGGPGHPLPGSIVDALYPKGNKKALFTQKICDRHGFWVSVRRYPLSDAEIRRFCNHES
jgi:hypothetical protein